MLVLLIGRDPFEFASAPVSIPPSSQPDLNLRKLPSVHRYAGNELNLQCKHFQMNICTVQSLSNALSSFIW